MAIKQYSAFPKAQHYWSFIIILFSVISGTLVWRGLTPLHIRCILQPKLTRPNTHIIRALTTTIPPTTAGTFHVFDCIGHVIYDLETNTYQNIAKENQTKLLTLRNSWAFFFVFVSVWTWILNTDFHDRQILRYLEDCRIIIFQMSLSSISFVNPFFIRWDIYRFLYQFIFCSVIFLIYNFLCFNHL